MTKNTRDAALESAAKLELFKLLRRFPTRQELEAAKALMWLEVKADLNKKRRA